MSQPRTITLTITYLEAHALRAACTAFGPRGAVASLLANLVVPGGLAATDAELRGVRERLDALIRAHDALHPRH